MDAALADRLQEMEATYDDLMAKLGSPEVASDPDRYTELAKEVSDLEDAVGAYREYREVADEAAEAKELLEGVSAGEEREYYRTVQQEAGRRLEQLESRLLRLIVPKDPRDERNVLVEIRSGAGGDEAALFAYDLVRMLQRYAERQGWKTEILDASHADVGGVREAVLEVVGKGAFSRLKYESGVHRVQRVPETESSGRIHTSTATVAVLPEADEVDVEIAPDDLRIDYYRSSGPGGQHVNTTDSAVRLTHGPSGIVVACQSERSQRQNKERAMKILAAKLQERAEAEAAAELAEERRSQVGTGERSEKIRTYNFPQNRVTDHRVNVTVHDVERVLDGGLDDFVDALLRHEEDALVRNA